MLVRSNAFNFANSALNLDAFLSNLSIFFVSMAIAFSARGRYSSSSSAAAGPLYASLNSFDSTIIASNLDILFSNLAIFSFIFSTISSADKAISTG